ncbi:xanthine dehydrogenase family protein molybdopterin-binding subunit [uncultured Salinisphaera sp.]|uniref:xanthine dehydrogenase family protein molybdopterin-binding subunit n=1 Tax=uncultured Salinisphaera sp. TaxID=359372 RepID=UPI0032B2F455|tara:strand:+ start:11851 stop:14055 length:2205 start_codon:yes stop_codon:yes gene_type:complete
MSNDIIGAAKPRIDGPDKLSGRARYAADHYPANLTYAYGVFSNIAAGKITDIDVSKAKQQPGVIEIFHHGNFPKLHRSPSNFAQQNKVDEPRLPFEDNNVYYGGQFVAMVVADTFENARNAAYFVDVSYQESEPVTSLTQALKKGAPKQAKSSRHVRGDADSAFSSAPHQVDAIYTTPVETHNPMEMHATTAYWNDGDLTFYEASQGVVFAKNTIAAVFGINPARVDARAPYIGSGFGSKLWIWPNAVAATAASRELGRPVQLVVPRAQMFTTTGHRPATHQNIKLGADANGKLQAIVHDSVNSTSFVGHYVETCGSVTKSLYDCDNVRVTHATAQVNQGTPTSMRAPGAAPGLFALESAIDELAEKIGMDPLALRKANYTETDGSKGLPFSSIHLMECYERGAKAFGWDKRNPEVGSMKNGNEILGWGVAACNWEALKRDCNARVALRADGRAFVSCATQDIGTGTYTIVAQTAADVLGLPLDKIEVELGDSAYPSGPLSGGSWASASALPAIHAAAKKAADQLKGYAVEEGAVFADADPEKITLADGKLSMDGGDSVAFVDVLQQRKVAEAFGEAYTSGATGDEYSFRSFGAHFVEIAWDPGISRLRVNRVVSAIDCGQIINSKTASNQVEGAIAMGIGMALFEQTEYDHRSGMPVNNNYAEYLVPTHADYPEDVNVLLLDYPDYKFNDLGLRGIGEIGITGMAAAVANAVYHATGKRVRDLPIRIEDLMSA